MKKFLDLPRTIKRINISVATRITAIVGTMWAAYAFTILAFISFPAALKSQSLLVIVAWIASTFLQLVLLPIILVGQDVASQKVNDKIEATHAITLAQLGLVMDNRQSSADMNNDIHDIAFALDIDLGEGHE